MSRFKFFGGKAIGAIQIKDYANLADGEIITLGSKVFEFNDTEGDVTAGRVWVNRITSNAAVALALIAAINANKPSKPCTAVIDPKDSATVRLYSDGRGAEGNIALTTTMADSNNVVSAIAGLMATGENGGNEILHRGKYIVTAEDVVADNVMIETSLPTGANIWILQLFTTAGLPKAHTGLVTATGTKLRVDFAGATDPAATDYFMWVAIER